MVALRTLVAVLAGALSMDLPPQKVPASALARVLCRSSEPCGLLAGFAVALSRAQASRSSAACSVLVRFHPPFALLSFLSIPPGRFRGYLPFRRSRSRTSHGQARCSRSCKVKACCVNQNDHHGAEERSQRAETYLSGSALCTCVRWTARPPAVLSRLGHCGHR